MFILVACDSMAYVYADCNNDKEFPNADVRAIGNWYPNEWSIESFTKMKYDSKNCKYYLAIAGLKKDTQYRWKVKIKIN
jgi:hypothetical protein